MIPLFSPSLGQEELSQIAESFKSGWIGKGQKVRDFEAAWAQHIGVNPENVVSVNCATEGLFQILELIRELNQGEVIIPSIHFVGARNAITSSFNLPFFCDVDKHTLNPTLENIQAAYTKYTRAVCLLHYGGTTQELDTIRQWCDEKGLWLIEDAACSPATIFKGRAAGTWGHFGVWSFDAMKILSTGDGGMVYCENPDHAREFRKRMYLGLESESGFSNLNQERWWEFDASYPGRRAVMNDVAAGIGLEQLKKLPEFIKRRADLTYFYDELLSVNYAADVSYRPGRSFPEDSFYFYWIQTPRRDELARHLREQGVYTSFRYYPLHRVFKTGQSLPGADYAADNTLLLPLHCNLTDSQVGYICDKVREFYNG